MVKKYKITKMFNKINIYIKIKLRSKNTYK